MVFSILKLVIYGDIAIIGPDPRAWSSIFSGLSGEAGDRHGGPLGQRLLLPTSTATACGWCFRRTPCEFISRNISYYLVYNYAVWLIWLYIAYLFMHLFVYLYLCRIWHDVVWYYVVWFGFMDFIWLVWIDMNSIYWGFIQVHMIAVIVAKDPNDWQLPIKSLAMLVMSL